MNSDPNLPDVNEVESADFMALLEMYSSDEVVGNNGESFVLKDDRGLIIL